MGVHKNINYVATKKSDYPTSSNSKDEIKFFLDVRDVKYDSSSTKNQLLDIVEELKNKKVKITVKGVIHD
jgi:anti-anti-sigma regulatory factor